MYFLAIEAGPVGDDSMLAELLAVVRRHDHKRVLEQAPVIDLIEKRPA